MPLLLVLASPLLGGAAAPGTPTPDIEAQGWRKVVWTGIRPADFAATPSGGVRVTGTGQGSLIWRRFEGAGRGAGTCLAWRWRVDAGPPVTDLTRRGGDDRAVMVAVGFAGFGPGAGFAARTQHAMAQAAAGDHRLPRSILGYVWGGTGQEAQGGFFASPWTGGITRLRVLRPATAPRGQWVEERVDLQADWRAAFGAEEIPALQEVAISTDSDDTGARVDVQVENIRLVPCSR